MHAGGKRKGTKGYYVEPTVFSNGGDAMKIAEEEIFGPVQQILKFDDIDDVSLCLKFQRMFEISKKTQGQPHATCALGQKQLHCQQHGRTFLSRARRRCQRM